MLWQTVSFGFFCILSPKNINIFLFKTVFNLSVFKETKKIRGTNNSASKPLWYSSPNGNFNKRNNPISKRKIKTE